MGDELTSQPQLAGGVASPFPADCFIVRGRGGRVWNQHGMEYTDLAMGYGAVSVGHAEPQIVRAVSAQSSRGTLMPGMTREELRARDALHHLFPNTSAASLHKTGSEAVAAAIRIARHATGRQVIIRCGFHGWHDEMVQCSRRWHASHPPQSRAPVRVPGVRDGMPPLEWLDSSPDSLAAVIAAHSRKIAAVILDPVQIKTRISETLSAVARMCRRTKILLILDELKTCPRVALGGVQAAYGVNADLTIVGKGLANGFPFSAVLGPDWLDRVRRESRIMGTFNGELTGLAAFSATVKILRREDGPSRLAELGKQLIQRTNERLDEARLYERFRSTPGPWPCMPRVHTTSPVGPDEKFRRVAVKHGACVLFPHMNFVCLRHSTKDLCRGASAIAAAAGEL